LNPSDLKEFIAKAKQAQTKMAELQRELAIRRVEGSAGGGMVTAVATGELRILQVEIEPSLLATGDREMIQDLTAAAVNAALSSAQKMIQEELQRASVNIAVPNLTDLLGPDAGS
jgi:DNA-binding YbaB/EbfC family protein